jgi:hypothetical protein
MRNQSLLPFLVLAVGPVLSAEVDKSFLQASAGLDRVLIPALVATNEEAGGDAETEVARLAEVWQIYFTGQQEVLSEAGGWSLIQSGITRRIEMAGKFVGSDDVRMAHIMLSQVREDLVRIRVALDAGYFVDQLVLFLAATDAELGDGSRSLVDMNRDVLVKAITDLLDRWTELEDAEFDADIFGFLWNEVSALDDLLAAEGDAIRELRSAAVSGATDDLDQLADAVRMGGIEVYLMFGTTE